MDSIITALRKQHADRLHARRIGIAAVLFAFILHPSSFILRASDYLPRDARTINIDANVAHEVRVRRGETLIVERSFVRLGAAVALPEAASVILFYRDDTLEAGQYYAATGTVHSATGGVARVTMAPEHFGSATAYDYILRTSGTNGAALRAYGRIIVAGPAIGEILEPDPVGIYEWAGTIHLTPPWLTPAQVQALIDPLDTLFSGIGSTGRVTSASADADKFLRADGTWALPAGSEQAIVAAGQRVSVVAVTNGATVTYTVTAADQTQDLSGYVPAIDAAFLAAITNLTEGANISITGTGRSRTIAVVGVLTDAAAFDPAGSAQAVSNALAAGAAAGATAVQPGDVVEYDAAHFNPDHWTWTTNANEITLTSYSGPDDVVVPGWINGLPVVGFGDTFAPGGAGKTNITSVSGGENVVAIDGGAFSYCVNLASVNFDLAASVGDYAFIECFALVDVGLPAATNIGFNAFAFCTSLTSVSLPSATSIGNVAFNSCTSLAIVTFYGNAPTEGQDMYSDIPANQVTNYVTDPTATGWGATFGGMPVVRLGIVADTVTAGAVFISGDVEAGSVTLGSETRTNWPTGGSGTTDHSALSNLTWTASGHTGTAGRLAMFSEGGQPGYSAIGPGLYLDGSDTLSVSNSIIEGAAAGAAYTGTVTAVVLHGTTYQPTNGIVTLTPPAPWTLDTYLGIESLSATNNLIWEPTRYAGIITPPSALTISMTSSTNIPRATYTLHIVGTNAVTYGANIIRLNTWTPAGTNTVVIGPWTGGTNWAARGIGGGS
jgi:hypothetical protein